MKYLLISILILSVSLLSIAQDTIQFPEHELQKWEVEAPLRFLAADELKGRRTCSPENKIAARYIAEYFRAVGVKYAPEMDNYYQKVPFIEINAPKEASLTIGDTPFSFKEEFFMLFGEASQISTDLVYAGQGWVDPANDQDDYKGLDVRGKIVLVASGTPNGHDPKSIFKGISQKRKWAHERGAAGLIEMYSTRIPWLFFSNFLLNAPLQLQSFAPDSAINKMPFGCVKTIPEDILKKLKNKKSIPIKLQNEAAFVNNKINCQNIIGVIEGTDSLLKNEYVLLSAHYDHIGTGIAAGRISPTDDIFNGARDNAFGTTALMMAAKCFALHPPKRSVILLATTGEELGLLGSEYYAENPIISLQKTVFNYNNDGAGYNSTEHIAIVGYDKTMADKAIKTGIEHFGLALLANPLPEMGLYSRSDQISFAKKGVPAVNFAPGTPTFDDAIAKYYHQIADEANSIDFDYLLNFCKTFVYSARLIANQKERPFWKKGDEYEKIGNQLYNNN